MSDEIDVSESTAGARDMVAFPPISEPEPTPLAPIVNGRDDAGRFAAGNTAAVGHTNPLARRVARLRSELLRASTPDRMRAGVEALWDKFAAGDVAAGKLILSYCLGEPRALDLIESVVRLQGLVLRGTSSNG